MRRPRCITNGRTRSSQRRDDTPSSRSDFRLLRLHEWRTCDAGACMLRARVRGEEGTVHVWRFGGVVWGWPASCGGGLVFRHERQRWAQTAHICRCTAHGRLQTADTMLMQTGGVAVRQQVRNSMAQHSQCDKPGCPRAGTLGKTPHLTSHGHRPQQWSISIFKATPLISLCSW